MAESDGLRKRAQGAKVDVEARWKEVMTEYEQIEKGDTFQKRNAKRRQVHALNEILLMDLEDEGVDMENDTKAKEILELRGKLGLEPALQGKLTGWDKHYMNLRFVATMLVFIGLTGGMFFLLPVRWMHPLLRKLGIPNDYLPMDILQRFSGMVLCATAGVRYRVEGQDKRVNSGPNFKPHITMFAHPSNLDPIVLLGSSPVVHKAVGKQVLFMMPIMGWAMRYSMGSVPLDRGNREKAVRSLNKMETSVSRWGRSLAIAPEGTRQPMGQLQEFKKGPFHLQKDLKIPIAPVVHFGPYELFPRKQKFCLPGHVVIRYLPDYLPPDGMDRDAVRKEVRRMMLKSLATDIPEDCATPLTQSEVIANLILIAFFLSLAALELYFFYQLHQYVFGGYSALAVLFLYLMFTISIELLTYYYVYIPSSAWVCDHLFW